MTPADLRKLADSDWLYVFPAKKLEEALRQAADEIERLRADLKKTRRELNNSRTWIDPEGGCGC